MYHVCRDLIYSHSQSDAVDVIDQYCDGLFSVVYLLHLQTQTCTSTVIVNYNTSVRIWCFYTKY